jgi:hypothetical protein
MHLKLNTRCPTTHQSLQTRTQHHTTQITISQTGCLGRFSRQPQGSSPSRLHATCTQSITHLHTFNNPPTQQTQSPHLTQHPNHDKLSSTPPPAPAITHPQPFSIPARLPTPTTLPPVPYAPASVNSGQRERERDSVLTCTTSGQSRPDFVIDSTFHLPACSPTMCMARPVDLVK